MYPEALPLGPPAYHRGALPLWTPEITWGALLSRRPARGQLPPKPFALLKAALPKVLAPWGCYLSPLSLSLFSRPFSSTLPSLPLPLPQ